MTNVYIQKFKDSINFSIKRVCFLIAFGFSIMVFTALYASSVKAAELGQLNLVCFSSEEIRKGLTKDDSVIDFGSVFVSNEDLEIVKITKMQIYNKKSNVLTTLLFESPEKGCIVFAEQMKSKVGGKQ